MPAFINRMIRMNLWLRLLAVLITSRFRAAIEPPGGLSVLNFRVWPHDLDPSIHMNNGRYLTIMDLGRLDIMLRTDLWRTVLKEGWTPIASAVAIRYRRELELFQKFTLHTRIVCWDETMVVMEQTFVIEGGPRSGQTAAQALFKGGLYDRKQGAFVAMATLMKSVGVTTASPEPTPDVAAFLRTDAEMKQTARSA